MAFPCAIGQARPAPPSADTQPVPIPIGRVAPDFTLQDIQGHNQALSHFRGQPVVLWFFCGCDKCTEVARSWAEMQRGGILRPAAYAGQTGRKGAITMIVYSGEADQARAFQDSVGLVPTETTLLTDPDSRITDEQYRSEPCPRAFLIDAKGIIRYVNIGKDDDPRDAPATAITARVIEELRRSAAPPKPDRSQHPPHSNHPQPPKK